MAFYSSDAAELTEMQKKVIRKLNGDVQKSNVRKRTTAMLAVLNPCESEFNLNELEIRALSFISQDHPYFLL